MPRLSIKDFFMAVKKKSTSAGTVVVYCNLPSGITYKLPDGRTVTFEGYPVSRLVSADGRALAAGKFGVTRDVSVADWEWIAAAYAGTALFQNGLIFAEPDEASGAAHAKELGGTRHGMEQADVWNRAADTRLPQAEATTPVKSDRG